MCCGARIGGRLRRARGRRDGVIRCTFVRNAGTFTRRSDCSDARKVWTIESHRMGVRKQRFCVFNQVRQTEETTDAEVWRADARCLAGGRESDDVLFFRVKPSRLEMRVRISDSDPEELVRCPMQT